VISGLAGGVWITGERMGERDGAVVVFVVVGLTGVLMFCCALRQTSRHKCTFLQSFPKRHCCFWCRRQILRAGIVRDSPPCCSNIRVNSAVLASDSTFSTCDSSFVWRTNVPITRSCSIRPSSFARGSPCAIQQLDSFARERRWAMYSRSA
jgi:hypothetical protein